MNVVVEDAEESEFRKKLKKVKYVEQNLWKQIVTGATPCISKSQIQGVFIVPKDECIEPLSNSQVMQRVSVSRDGTKDAEPFYFEWNYFNKDAGLYCLTDAKEHVLKLISQLFVQLGENGIGTDKNIGGGKFEVEIANELFSFGEPKDAKEECPYPFSSRQKMSLMDCLTAHLAILFCLEVDTWQEAVLRNSAICGKKWSMHLVKVLFSRQQSLLLENLLTSVLTGTTLESIQYTVAVER